MTVDSTQQPVQVRTSDLPILSIRSEWPRQLSFTLKQPLDQDNFQWIVTMSSGQDRILPLWTNEPLYRHLNRELLRKGVETSDGAIGWKVCIAWKVTGDYEAHIQPTESP